MSANIIIYVCMLIILMKLFTLNTCLMLFRLGLSGAITGLVGGGSPPFKICCVGTKDMKLGEKVPCHVKV